MKRLINDFLILIGIMTFVVFGWQTLEVIILGEINSNRVDTVIGVILTMSLYQNFKSWRGRNE